MYFSRLVDVSQTTVFDRFELPESKSLNLIIIIIITILPQHIYSHIYTGNYISNQIYSFSEM